MCIIFEECQLRHNYSHILTYYYLNYEPQTISVLPSTKFDKFNIWIIFLNKSNTWPH